jgi:hypothetical protein
MQHRRDGCRENACVDGKKHNDEDGDREARTGRDNKHTFDGDNSENCAQCVKETKEVNGDSFVIFWSMRVRRMDGLKEGSEDQDATGG